MQVVPIPGEVNKLLSCSDCIVWLKLENDVDVGPYIEGVSRMTGVSVTGLIRAVIIARISSNKGRMKDMRKTFLSP